MEESNQRDGGAVDDDVKTSTGPQARQQPAGAAGRVSVPTTAATAGSGEAGRGAPSTEAATRRNAANGGSTGSAPTPPVAGAGMPSGGVASMCTSRNGGCDLAPMATCVEPGADGEVGCVCPTGTSGDGIGVNGCLSNTACSTFKCDTDVVRVPERKLAWQRKHPTIDRCMFTEAQAYCTQLDLEGTGWRLPNQQEFSSIVDSTRENPAIDLEAFPDTKSARYWTVGFVFDSLGQPLYITPNASKLFIDYVFGSDEYTEFVNQGFADRMRLLIKKALPWRKARTPPASDQPSRRVPCAGPRARDRLTLSIDLRAAALAAC